VSVLDIKLKETSTCLERIGQLVSQRDKQYTETINEQESKNEKLTEELRESTGRVTMLEIGAKEHEKENARTMFAGFIVGAVLGAVFATYYVY
jgi:predicted ATP-dependent protease